MTSTLLVLLPAIRFYLFCTLNFIKRRKLRNAFVSPLVEKLKEEKAKEELKPRKTCPEYGCQDDDDALDEDVVDVEEDDKSRLDIGQVTDKVSEVGSSVQSGVDVSDNVVGH